MLIIFSPLPLISDHDQPKGRGKQYIAVAISIIVIVIVAACVHTYSETPLPPAHPYSGMCLLLILTILLN